MRGAGRRGLSPLLVAGLLLVGACAVVGAERNRRDYFTTADEPDHVGACRELRSGPGVVSNFEHPVLMKVLGAAGLPDAPLPRAVDEVRAARRLFPFVFGLLTFVAGLWASVRSGPAAGVAVACLVAIEPTLRGHAPLVHTDLLLTALLVTAAAFLDLSGPARAPRSSLLLLSGVTYGLALAAKYSALPFLPVFLGVALLRLRGPGSPVAARPAKKRSRRREAVVSHGASWGAAARRTLLFIALPALATAGIVQQVVVASTTSPAALVQGVDAKFRGFPQRGDLLRSTAGLPRGLAAYSAGLRWARASSVPGERINYFLGEVSGTGRLLYFPVALAVKLSTAAVLALVAALAACVLLFGRSGAAGRRRRLRLLAARSSLPFALGAAYLGAAMLANLNIGVRHVAPSVPLLLVAAAGVLRSSAWRRFRLPIAAAVVLLAAAEAALFLGREIPFGNLLAGGPPGVRRILSDSNVDWGERLDRAFSRAARGDLGRVGVVSLFWDDRLAAEAGVVRVVDELPGPVDSLIVSAFLWDLGPALERSEEGGPKWVYFRGSFARFLRTVREDAVSVEPYLDEYLIVRLRRAPPRPEPSR